MFNKGDVCLMELPSSNGHEQTGQRPCLIVSEIEANTILIIPFTTNLRATKYLNSIKIEPSSLNGLDNTSIALVFQIRAIDVKRLIKKLGTLEKEYLEDIKSILSIKIL
jgi:mRNA interferase MazF